MDFLSLVSTPVESRWTIPLKQHMAVRNSHGDNFGNMFEHMTGTLHHRRDD
jgi:hypothetical protein